MTELPMKLHAHNISVLIDSILNLTDDKIVFNFKTGSPDLDTREEQQKEITVGSIDNHLYSMSMRNDTNTSTGENTKHTPITTNS